MPPWHQLYITSNNHAMLSQAGIPAYIDFRISKAYPHGEHPLVYSVPLCATL